MADYLDYGARAQRVLNELNTIHTNVGLTDRLCCGYDAVWL